jgi:hypothetical protein
MRCPDWGLTCPWLCGPQKRSRRPSVAPWTRSRHPGGATKRFSKALDYAKRGGREQSGLKRDDCLGQSREGVAKDGESLPLAGPIRGKAGHVVDGRGREVRHPLDKSKQRDRSEHIIA